MILFKPTHFRDHHQSYRHCDPDGSGEAILFSLNEFEIATSSLFLRQAQDDRTPRNDVNIV